MHWLRLLNLNSHIVTITVCDYLVGEHLFLSALYTVYIHDFTRLFTIPFHFFSPCVFCWLDHPLISHSLTSARAHDITIVNNTSFVIVCPRPSTSDSSVNKFPFQNNRAGCTKHKIMSESFRITNYWSCYYRPHAWNKHSSISCHQKWAWPESRTTPSKRKIYIYQKPNQQKLAKQNQTLFPHPKIQTTFF